VYCFCISSNKLDLKQETSFYYKFFMILESATTFSITTLSIMTLSILKLSCLNGVTWHYIHSKDERLVLTSTCLMIQIGNRQYYHLLNHTDFFHFGSKLLFKQCSFDGIGNFKILDLPYAMKLIW
jgi:hypothetical protein